VAFGGHKKSSYRPRELGSYAKDFYTIVKTATSRRDGRSAHDSHRLKFLATAWSRFTRSRPS
jgi:hypothetical protein